MADKEQKQQEETEKVQLKNNSSSTTPKSNNEKAAVILSQVKKGKLIEYDEEAFKLSDYLKDAVGYKKTKPVISRMRERLREIKNFSRAKHVSITKGNTRHWTTIPPQVHICNLDAKMSNGVATITYQVYAMDDDRHKKAVETYGKNPNNPEKEMLVGVDYPISHTVVETIKNGQDIEVEYLEAGN